MGRSLVGKIIALFFLTASAEASNIHPTPVPTATLVPTATPAAAVSTATPAPTATLVPTATPQPTATLVPTATPQPTVTPQSTATPCCVNFTYSGTLTMADVHADNASFTVAHRVHYVTTGASTIVATMPASPTVGDVYTLMKADNGAGTAVWTRAGSQTLNGATTRTVSAQYKSDTCVYSASNVWICQGDGS